jgi:antitoxin HicB
MQTWTYPAVLEHREGEIIVRFPDFPEALTGADTLDDALALAADALEEAVLGYLDAGRHVPSPRLAAKGEEAITLDPHTAAHL